MNEENTIEAKTPWGNIVAHGSTVFIVVAIAALSWLTYTDDQQRSHEHADLACLIKLDLWVHGFPQDMPLNFSKMPTDLWGCLPRFLTETDERKR